MKIDWVRLFREGHIALYCYGSLLGIIITKLVDTHYRAALIVACVAALELLWWLWLYAPRKKAEKNAGVQA